MKDGSEREGGWGGGEGSDIITLAFALATSRKHQGPEAVNPLPSHPKGRDNDTHISAHEARSPRMGHDSSWCWRGLPFPVRTASTHAPCARLPRQGTDICAKFSLAACVELRCFRDVASEHAITTARAPNFAPSAPASSATHRSSMSSSRGYYPNSRVPLGTKVVTIADTIARATSESAAGTPCALVTTHPCIKPISSVLEPGRAIALPSGRAVRATIELGAVIGRRVRNISSHEAPDVVSGYVLALNLVAGCVGCPRSCAFACSSGALFDGFTPVSDFVPSRLLSRPADLAISLSIGRGAHAQAGAGVTAQALPGLIEFANATMTLEEGDLLLSGSPIPSFPVKAGDVIEGRLECCGQVLSSFVFAVEGSGAGLGDQGASKQGCD